MPQRIVYHDVGDIKDVMDCDLPGVKVIWKTSAKGKREENINQVSSEPNSRTTSKIPMRWNIMSRSRAVYVLTVLI